MKIKVVLRIGKINKQGQSPLMLRFTHDRTTKFVALGLSVEPHYWDKNAEMITADCLDRAALQSQIDSTLAGYRKKIQRLEALDMAVDFDNLFDPSPKCTPQWVDSFFERQIAAMKQAGIAYATEQIIDLIANGVNHIHIYSMNKPDVAAAIMNNLSQIYVREQA